MINRTDLFFSAKRKLLLHSWFRVKAVKAYLDGIYSSSNRNITSSESQDLPWIRVCCRCVFTGSSHSHHLINFLLGSVRLLWETFRMATLSRFRCPRETLWDLILEFCWQESVLRPVSRLWDTISELEWRTSDSQQERKQNSWIEVKNMSDGESFRWKDLNKRRLALTCLAAPGRCLTFPWIFIIHAATLLCTHHSLGGGGVSPELCFVECEPRTCELCVMHREQIAKSLRHNFGLLHRAGKAECDFSHH